MDRAEPPVPIRDESPTVPSRRRMRPWLVAVLVLASLVMGFVALRRSSGRATLSPDQVSRTVKAAVDKGIEDARTAPPDSTRVYQAIRPSLVVVRSEGARGAELSLGTGVVINDQGAILTARHVIAGAHSIRVTFSDGTEATALVANEDPKSDIAVLQANGSPEVIVPAVLGGGALHIGDSTFAVGNPLGLVGSLSAGVISGLDRSIPDGNGSTLTGLIQFDAAVNPGNSGGPLLNRDGQVIGIVTALANPSHKSFFIGIGFAVPIAAAGGAAGAPPQ